MLIGIIIVSFVSWFILLHVLFGSLKSRHPEAFSDMGKPHLVLNNTPVVTSNVLGFLFKRKWKKLADPRVAAICYALVFGGVAYFLSLGYYVYTEVAIYGT